MENEQKTGSGLSQVQIDSRKMYDELKDVLKLAEKCYELWEAKNRFMSVHKHWELLDPIVPYGKLGLRALLCMVRGGKAAWVFGVVNKIIEAEGMSKIEIPDEERGRLGHITKRYLAWSEEHLPPTAIELHWSAMYAQEMSNDFWAYVTIPDTQGNYGGTYFSGSLKQAQQYEEMAKALHERVKTKLDGQKEQWTR